MTESPTLTVTVPTFGSAPALNTQTPAPHPWRVDELTSYLRTGFSAQHGVAAGAMVADAGAGVALSIAAQYGSALLSATIPAGSTKDCSSKPPASSPTPKR